MTAKKAVVVGGGFAGLTAGYQLRKAGWDVTLLEAADEVGGRVRTVRKQGYYLTCTGQNSAIYYGKRAAENLLEHQSAHSTLRKHMAEPGQPQR